MFLLSIVEATLPLTNPVLKFLVILLVILLAPIVLNKFKIPHILGLIIAGAIIGPNGFNLLIRDSGIILSGTAGLLYIMFLAGLEINVSEFKKDSLKSLIFGFYTFTIPMVFGILTTYLILNLSLISSVLVASMYASHTLIAYPILSKLGVTKNRAVNIAVGGTLITDTLSLLVLAVIVGMTKGEVNSSFLIHISISVIVFGLIVIFLFPIIGRWFLKRYDDSVTQYIFVLAMVFLGAVLAEAAGVEAIIGAFLSGLALNRLIPSTSPLMNRVAFIGNAVFIPFFLIGVGMLLNWRMFFKDAETLKVAAIMTIVATISKYLAAWLTQKSFKFSIDERRLIFGLSNAQAAATLAAVMVGYNIILGINENGEPIRLLSENILNGTIVMIFITCTIATFSAQKSGRNISLKKNSIIERSTSNVSERVLIPISNPHTIEELISLSTIIKSKDNKNGFYALNIINNESNDPSIDSLANNLLERASIIASSSDLQMNKILRYDINVANGIAGVVKENNITDLILGLHIKKESSEPFIGKITESLISKSNTTTFVYNPVQPISTIKRHIVVVPLNAEQVIGFPLWLSKILNIKKNTGSKLVFYAGESTTSIIKNLLNKNLLDADFNLFDDWNDFLKISRNLKSDDNLIVVLSRENKPSYNENMMRIPEFLNNYFQSNSFILIYPVQIGIKYPEPLDLINPSLDEPAEKLDIIGRYMKKKFRRK